MLDSWFPSSHDDSAALERSDEQQRQLDAATAKLALYHFDSCVFCARVRKTIARLRLNIELRDILQDARHRRELAAGGGHTTVPCLRVIEGGQASWLYESADIIAYLVSRFGASASGSTSPH